MILFCFLFRTEWIIVKIALCLIIFIIFSFHYIIYLFLRIFFLQCRILKGATPDEDGVKFLAV